MLTGMPGPHRQNMLNLLDEPTAGPSSHEPTARRASKLQTPSARLPRPLSVSTCRIAFHGLCIKPREEQNLRAPANHPPALLLLLLLCPFLAAVTVAAARIAGRRSHMVP